MERLSIKTPDDFISLMGHTLGFWPEESLVCVTLDNRRIGATLRVGLPAQGVDTDRYVDDVVQYISNDKDADGVIFGMFTHADWSPRNPRPHEAMMARLTYRLAESNITVRDGWLIGETSFASYTGLESDPSTRYPLDRITASEINAELVFRGSSVKPNANFRIPNLSQRNLRDEVLKQFGRIESMDSQLATACARTLRNNLLAGTELPADDQAAELLADFKVNAVRDRLIGDIPGLNDTLGDLLLAQTKKTPHWHRVDRAQEILFHLYSRADGADAAPILTSLGIIQWWEGKGLYAHQCFQRALEADPDYVLAQLSDQMVGAGILAPWTMDKNAAYQPPSVQGPQIPGMGMA